MRRLVEAPLTMRFGWPDWTWWFLVVGPWMVLWPIVGIDPFGVVFLGWLPCLLYPLIWAPVFLMHWLYVTRRIARRKVRARIAMRPSRNVIARAFRGIAFRTLAPLPIVYVFFFLSGWLAQSDDLMGPMAELFGVLAFWYVVPLTMLMALHGAGTVVRGRKVAAAALHAVFLLATGVGAHFFVFVNWSGAGFPATWAPALLALPLAAMVPGRLRRLSEEVAASTRKPFAAAVREE